MNSEPLPNLDALSIGELRHLYETYRSASQLFGWRAGQPWANERPGGHILDSDADHCLRAMDVIFSEARRRNVSLSSMDADVMLEIWALRLADDPSEIAGAASYLGALAA